MKNKERFKTMLFNMKNTINIIDHNMDIHDPTLLYSLMKSVEHDTKEFCNVLKELELVEVIECRDNQH